MPMIDARFSVPMTPAQQTALKTRFGRAVECLPGKSESWLMVGLTPNACLYFKGDPAPAAYVEVSVFGELDPRGCENMTAEICAAVEEILSIPPDRVYVRYGSTKTWGWNGGNF